MDPRLVELLEPLLAEPVDYGPRWQAVELAYIAGTFLDWDEEIVLEELEAYIAAAQ